MNTPEPRRPPRVDVRVPVALLSSEARVRLAGRTRNLSEGGMFIESARLLPVGTSVRCDVSLARRPVELFGRVAWSRSGPVDEGRGMGIMFLAPDPGACAVLRDLVATHAAPPAVRDQTTAPPERPGWALLALLFVTVATAVAALVVGVLRAHAG